MKKPRLLCTVGLTGLFLFGCQELDVQPNLRGDASFKTNTMSARSASATGTAKAGVADVIDFEGLEKGAIVSEVSTRGGAGAVIVWGHNPDFAGQNAAMIFYSATPQGGTVDLGTPNEDFGGPGIGDGGAKGSPYANQHALGNLLIVTQDFDADDPDDADAKGSMITFDFSQLETVIVSSLDIIDIEEDGATVTFYDADGNRIGNVFELPEIGDNGVHTYSFGGGVSGVVKMEVMVNGSAAIDNVRIRRKCNNGWGNGEDCAPGNSLANQPKFEDPNTGPSPCNSPRCSGGDR